MGGSSNSKAGRSVHIGGSADQNVIVTGDQNVTKIQYQKITLPTPESVDISKELSALGQLLSALKTPDTKKIANALSDAEDELNHAKPDKDEIGQALDRALGYAKKAEGFIGIVEKLQPHIKNAAAWLGKNWHKILGVVGLIV